MAEDKKYRIQMKMVANSLVWDLNRAGLGIPHIHRGSEEKYLYPNLWLRNIVLNLFLT
jgi:hypothetical protein